MRIYNNPLLQKSPGTRQKELAEAEMTFENFKQFMEEANINVDSVSEPDSQVALDKFKQIEDDYMKQLADHYAHTKKLK